MFWSGAPDQAWPPRPSFMTRISSCSSRKSSLRLASDSYCAAKSRSFALTVGFVSFSALARRVAASLRYCLTSNTTVPAGCRFLVSGLYFPGSLPEIPQPAFYVRRPPVPASSFAIIFTLPPTRSTPARGRCGEGLVAVSKGVWVRGQLQGRPQCGRAGSEALRPTTWPGPRHPYNHAESARPPARAGGPFGLAAA